MRDVLRKFVVVCFVSLFSLAAMASETVDGAKKDFEKFKQTMNMKLQDIDKKIENLKASSKERGQVAKQNSIKELEEARDKLKSDLKDVQDMSSNTWSNFKSGFAKSVDTLNEKIQKTLKE